MAGLLNFTKMTLSLVTLISMATLIECRSIPSSEDGSLELSWLPEGMSLEDWDECLGRPCDKKRTVLTKLHELQILNLEKDNIELNNEDIAYDVSVHDASLDGCILLNEDQLEYLINQTKEELLWKNDTEQSKEEQEAQEEHSRHKRSLWNFKLFPNRKWQKHEFPLQYTFDGKHNDAQRDIIRGAIHHWEEQTCIRFEEIKGRPSPSDTYIVFSESNYVCHSYMGKQGKGPQPVFLAENCLWNFGTPVHEIAHVLGVLHTHMRPDRDQHVKIHNENLGYYKGQYKVIPDGMTLGIPYDHSSVMHYSPMDGSYNGKTVIEARDPQYQSSMGQRVGLSFYDAMLVNKEYCSDICRGPTWRPCQRGGYQDPNNCHRCKCPDGLGGPYCEDVAPSSPGASCGGVLSMPKYMTRVINSPKYDPGHNSFYYDYTECNWLIKVPAGWNVVLRFQDEFGLFVSKDGECFHWVEVKYRKDKQRNGPRFCDSQTPHDLLVSEDQEMVVIFKSNFSSSNHRANVGFQAIISMVPDILVGGNSNKPAPPPPRQRTPVPTTSTTTTSTTSTSRTTESTSTSSSSTSSTTSPTTTTTTRSPRRPPPRAPPAPPAPVPLPRDHTIENFLWFCNFETGTNQPTWCNITQEQYYDQFDWEIIAGQTDSKMTGPEYAFNGRNYVYIEASRPRKAGDEAIMRLPRFLRTGEHCLSWRYFMYGHHINTLKIVVEGDGRYDVLWSRTGEQRPVQWLAARVTVTLTDWARILFVGSRGLEYSGDIAVDAISLLSGPCWSAAS